MWVAGEDSESQRLGVLVIFWPDINKVVFDSRWEVSDKDVLTGSPTRAAAFHVCLGQNLGFRLLKAQIGLVMPEEKRKRIIFHLGE